MRFYSLWALQLTFSNFERTFCRLYIVELFISFQYGLPAWQIYFVWGQSTEKITKSHLIPHVTVNGYEWKFLVLIKDQVIILILVFKWSIFSPRMDVSAFLKLSFKWRTFNITKYHVCLECYIFASYLTNYLQNQRWDM